MRAKNDEEEFNTGLLSVLIMSVKNNTQMVHSLGQGLLQGFGVYIFYIRVLDKGCVHSKRKEAAYFLKHYLSGKCISKPKKILLLFSYLLCFVFLYGPGNAKDRS